MLVGMKSFNSRVVNQKIIQFGLTLRKDSEGMEEYFIIESEN